MIAQDPKLKGYLISESAVTTANPQIVENNGVTTSILTNLQDGDTPNRNKRIYGTKTLQQAVNAPYVQERLKTNSFYGEAGHPLKADMERQLYIDQTRISHLIKKVWFEGNTMKGIVESANTNVGKDFKGLIDQGSSVAFSMRGVGPISEKKGDFLEIKPPLSIFTYDWVIHPSHSIAYMEKVLHESTLDMLLGKDQYSLSEKTDTQIISESASIFENGILIPVQQETLIDMVKTGSRNFKQICEQFEFGMGSQVIVNEDKRTVDVRNGSETVRVFLEDYITLEIDDFLSKL
jgi:Prohead core protein serine protease